MRHRQAQLFMFHGTPNSRNGFCLRLLHCALFCALIFFGVGGVSAQSFTHSQVGTDVNYTFSVPAKPNAFVSYNAGIAVVEAAHSSGAPFTGWDAFVLDVVSNSVGGADQTGSGTRSIADGQIYVFFLRTVTNDGDGHNIQTAYQETVYQVGACPPKNYTFMIQNDSALAGKHFLIFAVPSNGDTMITMEDFVAPPLSAVLHQGHMDSLCGEFRVFIDPDNEHPLIPYNPPPAPGGGGGPGVPYPTPSPPITPAPTPPNPTPPPAPPTPPIPPHPDPTPPNPVPVPIPPDPTKEDLWNANSAVALAAIEKNTRYTGERAKGIEDKVAYANDRLKSLDEKSGYANDRLKSIQEILDETKKNDVDARALEKREADNAKATLDNFDGDGKNAAAVLAGTSAGEQGKTAASAALTSTFGPQPSGVVASPGGPPSGGVVLPIGSGRTVTVLSNPFDSAGPFGGLMANVAAFVRRMIAWSIVVIFFTWVVGKVRVVVSELFRVSSFTKSVEDSLNSIKVLGSGGGLGYLVRCAGLLLLVPLFLTMPLVIMAAVTAGLPFAELKDTFTAGPLGDTDTMLGQAIALANVVIPWAMLIAAPIWYFITEYILLPSQMFWLMFSRFIPL